MGFNITLKNIDPIVRPSEHQNLLSLPGPVLSGLAMYFILSYFFVPFRITIPLSVIMSILIFGLTNYYQDKRTNQSESKLTEINFNKSSLNIIFVIIYIFLLIIILTSKPNSDIYIPWGQFTSFQIVRLAAAIAFSIFMPGYAIVSALDRRGELTPVIKFLLSYVISMLVSSLTVLIMSSNGFSISQADTVLDIIYVSLLVQFVIVKIFSKSVWTMNYRTYVCFALEKLRKNSSEFLVFASLIALVVLSTDYMYNGGIIGDQWLHHSRALMFLSGTFRDLAHAGADEVYPPIMSAFLASLFAISGSPSVNAYASINFLNILPTFSFYYFFSKWFPNHRKAALLAAALFMLSSGFGWAYVLNLIHVNPVTSGADALDTLTYGGIKSFDIRIPNNFIDVGNPDISSPLQILMLPAGFALLGLIRDKISGKFRYYLILSLVTVLGYLSHDEFGIFVICACLLPLVFRMPEKGIVYFAIFTSLAVAILIDILVPGDFYGYRRIIGIPIYAIYLSFAFVMWILYTLKIHNRAYSQLWSHIRGFLYAQNRFTLSIAIISAVVYLYVFCFIVWGTISFQDQQIQTSDQGQRVVPWYLYPMRFGACGLLGLAFVLSLFFKRYEKEVLVFGLLAVLAFLTSVYYDDNRSHKYIMVAMVGFSSLLLYRLLGVRTTILSKPLVNGMFLGLVITASSLSIMMYEGYSALILDNPDYDKNNSVLPHRIFPSDLRVFNFLHNNIDLKDNIAIPEDQFVRVQGSSLDEKLAGFVGTPLNYRLRLTPLILDASSITNFYTLLDYSGTKYIVLNHNSDQSSEFNLFAYQNFHKYYEDENYSVLSVPDLAPPSTESNVGLIFQETGLLERTIASTPQQILEFSKVLQYNNKSFVLNDDPRVLKNDKTIIINGTNGTTILSKPIQENINYIEATFRVVTENGNNNHAGIVWNDGNKEYYAFLRSNMLSIYTHEDQEFVSVPIIRQENTWYTLKIFYSKNFINVFVNDEIKTQLNTDNITNILSVGIRNFNTTAEFKPLIIGRTSNAIHELDVNPIYSQYYPVSALALSKIKYETFLDDDPSFFSKSNIVLTFDPPDIKDYLDFIKRGNSLVVLNTNDEFNGGFSKFLSIQSSNETGFDSIEGFSGFHVSGFTKNIKIYSPGSSVKYFYVKNNKEVVPFVIEKNYGNGKIIFVNTIGYYQGISQNPAQYFDSLSDITNLVELDHPTPYVKSNLLQSFPKTWFIGNLMISGHVVSNSSSVIFPINYEFYSVVESNSNNSSPQLLTNGALNESLIKDLKLSGKYMVTISSAQLENLPSISENNYVGLSFPEGSNMTIILLNGSSAKFTVGEDNTPIEITDGKIQFHKIKNKSQIASIPILMKAPTIDVNGTLSFENLHAVDPRDRTKWLAQDLPINATGRLVAKFGYVDNVFNRNENYVTYLDLVQSDVAISNSKKELRIPGDISYVAKQQNVEVPIQDAITSRANFIAILLILSLVVFSIFLKYKLPKRKIQKLKE